MALYSNSNYDGRVGESMTDRIAKEKNKGLKMQITEQKVAGTRVKKR